jgi:hypothetical protein
LVDTEPEDANIENESSDTEDVTEYKLKN